VKIVDPTHGDDRFYRFCFAMQNPLVVGLLSVSEASLPELPYAWIGAHEAMCDTWEHTFAVGAWMDMHYTDDGTFSSASQCYLLMNTTHRMGTSCFVADGEWSSIDDVKGWLGAADFVETLDDDSKDNPTFDMDVFTRHPFLADWLCFGDGKFEHKATNGHSRGGGSSHDDRWHTSHGDMSYMVDEDDIMDALLKKRLELDLASDSHATGFHIGLRGGPALAARTGEAFDGLRAECCEERTKAWARLAGLRLSFTVVIRFGDDLCRTLCEAWVARMTYLYTMYTDGDVYTPALDTFSESPSLTIEYDRGSVETRARINQIRSLRPLH
jgi:hypothetical protein